MTSRARISGLLALAVALLLPLLAWPALARADQAYDKVASAYAQAGGHLDPCAFTQAELQAAVRGIPPEIRDVVPDLRRAMLDGIAAHVQGTCRGGRADEGTTGGAGVPGSPGVTTPTTTQPPVTTPSQTTTAPVVPAPVSTTPTTPAPAAATPAPATTSAQPAAAHERDRTPLLVALVAVGALLLLALLAWGWARMRGWDPTWAARMRHAWGEAGFRTTSTWSEFTDWLRLGR